MGIFRDLCKDHLSVVFALADYRFPLSLCKYYKIYTTLLTIFHNHLFLSFRISCQNKDYEEDGGFPMLAIPSALQTKFEEHLRNKTIQNSLHGVYKKWLQYYLDFCRKYHFPPIHKESLPHFILKLQEKKQTTAQQELSITT